MSAIGCASQRQGDHARAAAQSARTARHVHSDRALRPVHGLRQMRTRMRTGERGDPGAAAPSGERRAWRERPPRLGRAEEGGQTAHRGRHGPARPHAGDHEMKQGIGTEAIRVKGWLAAQQWLLTRRATQFAVLPLFLAGPWLGYWIVKSNLNYSLTL